MAGAVILGYLGDLISGAPVGLQALAAGLSCLLAFSLNRRILVRGLAITLGFSAFVGGAAALLILILRVMNGITAASPSVELARVVGVAISTGAVGPLVLRLFRRVDATFARDRDRRDAALRSRTRRPRGAVERGCGELHSLARRRRQMHRPVRPGEEEGCRRNPLRHLGDRGKSGAVDRFAQSAQGLLARCGG